MHFGVSLWPQNITWPEMKEFGLLADELGLDSLWTWDHFFPIVGDPTRSNLEGWQILPAWAAVTSRIKIGMLVSGNTYRHPAVLANMAAALDHVSQGRAILGLGAAWFELEHNAYGIPFDTAGIRLGKLAEACAVVRSLLDQPSTDFQGKYYQLTQARCEPKPIQKRLPIMIGGGGERKTLRITAQYADYWNGMGSPEQMAHKLQVLRQHCQEVGRDFDSILTTAVMNVCVRDDESAIPKLRQAIYERHGLTGYNPTGPAGGVEAVAQALFQYWKAGIRGIILGMPAPYDRETLERVAREVRPRLSELIATAPAPASR